MESTTPANASIPPLPPRSHTFIVLSPHQVLSMTSQKLDREASSGTPDLRRLVLCANTYDTALILQTRLERTRSDAIRLAAPPKKQSSKVTPCTQDDAAAYFESIVGDADAKAPSEAAGICTSVVEVVDDCDDEGDDDDELESSCRATLAPKIGLLEYTSHGVSEDLFEDWDLDNRSDSTITDSSESDTESDGSEAASEDDIS